MEELYNLMLKINEKYECFLSEEASILEMINYFQNPLKEFWYNATKVEPEKVIAMGNSYLNRYDRLLHSDYLISHEDMSTSDVELALDRIVYMVRQKICLVSNGCVKSGAFFNTSRYCRIAAQNAQTITDKENLENNIVLLESGIGLKYYDHAFNYVKINGKYYVIDCTYSQFLSLYYMSLNAILISDCINADPGYFMASNDKGYELLNQLLHRGWFEATEENMKIYLDSFVLANRNGNYYLRNSESDLKTTEFSGKFYLDLLSNYIERLNKVGHYLILSLNDNSNYPTYGEENELGVPNHSFTKEDIVKLSKRIEGIKNQV